MLSVLLDEAAFESVVAEAGFNMAREGLYCSSVESNGWLQLSLDKWITVNMRQ